MAPLESPWLAHRVEGVTKYAGDEVTGTTPYSPSQYVRISLAGTSSVSRGYDSCLSTWTCEPSTAGPVVSLGASMQPRAPTIQSPLTPTSTANIPLYRSDSSLTAPPARIQSGKVVGTQGKETTTEISTTFVTTGVFTTSLTTVLLDGQTLVVATTTQVHTVTVKAVPTGIGTVSSKSGPPAGIIGGVTGAIAIVILAVIVPWILIRKRRHLKRSFQVAPNTGPPTKAGVISTIPRPFLDTLSPQEQPAVKRGRGLPEHPHPLPHHNQANNQNNADPFQDPEIVQSQEGLVTVGARDALDRLQELTREVEEELRGLGNRARRGQLSDSERERLDEIRRTTGFTVVYDPGCGRSSATSSIATPVTSPPSYHSDAN